MWEIMYEVGLAQHLIRLITNLYVSQAACVRTTYGRSNSVQVTKGVRQGCILSPTLFNLYTDIIMHKALSGYTCKVLMKKPNGQLLKFRI